MRIVDKAVWTLLIILAALLVLIALVAFSVSSEGGGTVGAFTLLLAVVVGIIGLLLIGRAKRETMGS